MELTLETVDTQSPDTLADLYTELTADLAFAQTHYPSSRITLYLNNMAYALHGSIYKNSVKSGRVSLRFGRTKCRLPCMKQGNIC